MASRIHPSHGDEGCDVMMPGSINRVVVAKHKVKNVSSGRGSPQAFSTGNVVFIPLAIA